MAKRREITIEEAKSVWEELKNNEFFLIFFPTFEDFWKECERTNSFFDAEWQEFYLKTQTDKECF